MVDALNQTPSPSQFSETGSGGTLSTDILFQVRPRLAGTTPLKPGARLARALPVGSTMHFNGPMRNNGWVALRVLPNGGEKRRRSRAGRTGPRIPTESIRPNEGSTAASTAGLPGKPTDIQVRQILQNTYDHHHFKLAEFDCPGTARHRENTDARALEVHCGDVGFHSKLRYQKPPRPKHRRGGGLSHAAEFLMG